MMAGTSKAVSLSLRFQYTSYIHTIYPFANSARRRISSATTAKDIIQNTPKELPVKKVEFVVGLAATVAGAAFALEAAVEISETGLDVLRLPAFISCTS